MHQVRLGRGHRATSLVLLVLLSILTPPSWCWGPAGGIPAVAGRRRAPWQGNAVRRGREEGCKFSAGGEGLLAAAPTGPRPQAPWLWAVLLAGLCKAAGS